MNGIAEILKSGRAPGVIISSGRTEQRKLEDQSAKDALAAYRRFECEQGSRWQEGIEHSPDVIKRIYEGEINDPRNTSVTDRYDERMKRVEDVAESIFE